MIRRLLLTSLAQHWPRLHPGPCLPPMGFGGACKTGRCWSSWRPAQLVHTQSSVPERHTRLSRLFQKHQLSASVETLEMLRRQSHSCVFLRSNLHTSSPTPAGSNKWSKVKHIKGPKDHQRSLLATKLMRQIRVVIKEGGSNPDMNPELARLVGLAKSSGIAKATIENAIKNAVNSKDKQGAQYICEGQGPRGSAIIVEYVTDNHKRSRDELISIFKSHGCTVGGQGSVLHSFKKKGVIEVGNPDDQEPMTYDLAMELAIEAGAEDVITDQEGEDGQNVFKLICDQADFGSTREALGKTNHRLGMASLEYIPESNVALPAQELEKMGALFSKLEEHDSVLKVSHNIAEET